MIDRNQATEIAVAASLVTRERADLDHDEVGILTVMVYHRLIRDGDAARLVPAREIADAVCAKVDVMREKADASRGVSLPGSPSNPIRVHEGPVWSSDEERAFAARIQEMDLDTARAISDQSVNRLSEGWSEVESVSLAPVPRTFAQTGLGADGRGVSMLVVATFMYGTGGQTSGHLSFIMDDPDGSLDTGRLVA